MAEGDGNFVIPVAGGIFKYAKMDVDMVDQDKPILMKQEGVDKPRRRNDKKLESNDVFIVDEIYTKKEWEGK